MDKHPTTTADKALRVNLDSHFYGTFAEIGAGQEVARWFFRVGGAAGTIAKSMSAYDMTFSDSIYGKSGRYVSKERLHAMLSHEYALLLERLAEKRGDRTSFFVYADTVSARNFLGTNECHGWMGVQFQVQPNAEPNTIILHVNMLDEENLLQQEALGIIGVNLIHGALYQHSDPVAVVKSLLDNLSVKRIEVDMIKFSGPYFASTDNRLMALELVELGLSNATMLGPDGDIYMPSEVFHKKPILIERGSFRPVTHVNLDMLHSARKQFAQELDEEDNENVVEVLEITMRNLLSTGTVDHKDFLARADLISAVGKNVLISNYAEYYRLANYLWRYTKKRIGIVMGIPSLNEIFDQKYYTKLEGGILESFGRLFKNDLRLYIYPYMDPQAKIMTHLKDVHVAPELDALYRYLLDNRGLEAITDYNEDFMHIFSRAVLAKIREQDMGWEDMVPTEVADLIKKRHFFGYRES